MNTKTEDHKLKFNVTYSGVIDVNAMNSEVAIAEALELIKTRDSEADTSSLIASDVSFCVTEANLEMPNQVARIAEIFEQMNRDFRTHSPEIVTAENMDLSSFEKQECAFSGIEFEYINQNAGSSEDDYYGTVVWPIGDIFLKLEYYS